MPGQCVHTACRLDFTNRNAIARDLRKSQAPVDSESAAVLRSSTPTFSFGEHCLFCGKPQKYEGRKRGFELVPVLTTVLHESLSDACETRGDDWTQLVKARLQYGQDIRARDAVYHKQCYVNFKTERAKIPKRFSDSSDSSTQGRPANAVTQDAFLPICDFVRENDEEQLTISDLMEKMDKFLEGTTFNSYGFTHMKNKLKEHFGEEIIIAELDGKPNIVTLRNTTAAILHKFYETNRKADTEAEAMRIVKTAANLIRSDVKCIDVSNDFFPSTDQMMDPEKAVEYLPPMLATFLKIMFAGKHNELKVASIRQAIMAATRPGVLLAPLQLGLSVEAHHQFGSRCLVDSLHNHGFGCSYTQVQENENCSAIFQSHENEKNSDKVVQFVADNVDSNLTVTRESSLVDSRPTS